MRRRWTRSAAVRPKKPSSPTNNSKSIIVAGPTGVGKSVFAVELAIRLGGEILGADAYQIYSGLEILTAQPSAAMQARVPHHLIGTLPVSESFDAARFRDMALATIKGIRQRGKVPIIVGGSGMYLKALTHGLDTLPPRDDRLREELSRLSLDQLLQRLDDLDPEARAYIDCLNPRRVQRALEICLQSGQPFAATRQKWHSKNSDEFRGLFLTRDRAELYARIAENVRAMFPQGVVDEVRKLENIGPTASLAIGLREIQAHIRGEISEQACIEAMIPATCRYAKRQLTWFRNQSNFPSIDLTASRDTQDPLSIALGALGEA